MEGLYAPYPRRFRLIFFLVSIAVMALTPLELPYLAVFMVALFVVLLIGLTSIFRPDMPCALQQDKGDRRLVDEQRKLVDVLYAAGVFDKNTTPEVADVEAVGPGCFVLTLSQVGKTEKQIKDAVQGSLMAFNAVSADVIQKSGTQYLITYRVVSEFDILAGVDVSYSDLLRKEAESGY